ncbi:cbb3-type cytochrome oxidase assembly protein CcoS [Aquabacterium sp.]|uniref:cbb3-type cytochrome oxidase assembly protein CcoS n=1 Tax=Aquabacterium sp. TaxID=1872578 RepID=UPI0035ADE678
MEIVYLLVPLSVGLALIILGVFAWALRAGQFDDLEREGLRILEPEQGFIASSLDEGQS